MFRVPFLASQPDKDLDRGWGNGEIGWEILVFAHRRRRPQGLRPDLTNNGQTPTAQCAHAVAAVLKAHPPPKCSHYTHFSYSRCPLDRARPPRRLPQRPRIHRLDPGPGHLRLLQLVCHPSAGLKLQVPLPSLERSSRRQDHLRRSR